MEVYLTGSLGNPLAGDFPVSFTSYHLQDKSLVQRSSLVFIPSSRVIRQTNDKGLVRVIVYGKENGHATIIFPDSCKDEIYRVSASQLCEK